MTWRIALLLIVAGRSWACACAGNWPSVKQAWESSRAVFLGTVEIADPDEDGRQLIFQNQLVRIRVDEAFKGVFRGRTIELHQGANDCEAKFRTGQHAVFYLNSYRGSNGDEWIVPPCTHSLGSAAPGGDDLLFLRGLPKSAIGTRLSGEVELYEDSPTQAFKRVGGIPNVRVKISGRSGLIREAVTNGDGTYEMYGLPPGKYSVGIDVPNGLRIDFPVITGSTTVKDEAAAVQLSRKGGAGVGFVLKADTRLSGHMLDSEGEPLRDVCIDLEPVEGRGENGARFFDCSKAGGMFKMEMMPAGRYWLVARDEVSFAGLKSKSTLYYPGVRDRQRASIVTIEAGKYVDSLDIRLPSGEQRHKISGRFQFADGVAVPGATVTFEAPEHGYTETAMTRGDGSFALSALDGSRGQLSGALAIIEPILRSCPDLKVEPLRRGMFRFMHAAPIALSLDSDHEDINLVLTSPSCKSWPAGRR